MSSHDDEYGEREQDFVEDAKTCEDLRGELQDDLKQHIKVFFRELSLSSEVPPSVREAAETVFDTMMELEDYEWLHHL